MMKASRRSSSSALRITAAVSVFLAASMATLAAGGRPAFTWVSDTDIVVVKAYEVTIGKERITLVGEARLPGSVTGRGKRETEMVTLVIKRPPLDFNDGQLRRLLADPRRASHAKKLDKDQFTRMRGMRWAQTVQKARLFQSGKTTVWPLRYYKPSVMGEEGSPKTVEGFGFFSPAGR